MFFGFGNSEYFFSGKSEYIVSDEIRCSVIHMITIFRDIITNIVFNNYSTAALVIIYGPPAVFQTLHVMYETTVPG